MTLRLWCIVLFLSLVSVCCFGLPCMAQESAEDYWSLLFRLKDGDTGINFTELRILFAKLPGYNPYLDLIELRPKEDAMWKAYKDGKFEEAQKLGNEILEKNYLRSMTHFILSKVYEQLKDPEKQKFHDEVFFRLVHSVIESGDGKTPETAMTVISIEEEYNVLNALGFEQESQELVEKNGKWFDRLQAKNAETGESRDFWFDINLFHSPVPEEESASTEATSLPTPASTATVTPTPSVEPTPTPSPSQGLTVNPPPGWVPQTTEDPTEIGYYQLLNNQGVTVAEYIAMCEDLPSPMDLQGYLRFIQQDRLNPSSVPGYTPQETSETTLAGFPALRHDFLFTPDGQQLKGRVFFVILDNQVYLFLFYSTVSDFPNLETTFAQALASISVQGESKVEPGFPGMQSQPAGTYQDPGGLFEITLPEGATKKEDLQNGAVFRSPNDGEIYFMKFASSGEAENTAQGIAKGKDFRAETSLNASGRTARVRIYTFTQNNENYAMLVANYPGTPVLVVFIVPVSEYEASRNWMEATITGIRFR